MVWNGDTCLVFKANLDHAKTKRKLYELHYFFLMISLLFVYLQEYVQDRVHYDTVLGKKKKTSYGLFTI